MQKVDNFEMTIPKFFLAIDKKATKIVTLGYHTELGHHHKTGMKLRM